MGFTPPPAPEPWFVIKARREQLKQQGEAITMENLDPAFWKWYTYQRKFYSLAIPIVLGGGIFLTLVLGLVWESAH